MPTPATPLKSILNAQLAGRFRTSRGIETVADLLDFWPRRYRTREADLGNLAENQYLVAVAEVRSVSTRAMSTRRGTMLTAVLSDGRHEIEATFFDARGHQRQLVPGTRAIFAGTVGSRVWQGRRRWQLTHPGYTLLEEYDTAAARELIPVYRQVGTLHTWTVSQCVRQVIDTIDDLPDPLPAPIREKRGLLGRMDALRAIHVPDSLTQVELGKHRMAYEEALVLQLALAQRRARQASDRTLPRMPRAGGLLDTFDARLPFELTAGQSSVGAQIAADLAQPVPMHRLLQGEVGSGKTLVALRAMLAVVDAGGQAALLAPTEVLAQQHHRSITTLLGDLAQEGMLSGAEQATRVALLTGSQSASQRREPLLEAASGRAGIVIGTHALIQEQVTFADLALVVVDEQHRFGVEQRDVLRGKGQAPHVLVMTATPIPRTVAMTVFGDLETSTLTELPAGRAPITSHVVPEWKPWFGRTWERVAEEVALGRQVYVVCPRIGGDDEDADDLDGADILVPDQASDLVGSESGGGVAPGRGELSGGQPSPDQPPPRPMHSVVDTLETLRSTPALAGLRIEPLHGRLPTEEKEATMRAFADGEIDVLVSTTVIEVGVDVPTASVMVVLDADRFGISQLHQLRGRVGRGGLPGLCLLVSGTESALVGERLEAVAGTSDGFELARLDLRQRREGDILGAAQHGHRSQLRFLHVLQDEKLIADAREDALELVADDPWLERQPGLAAALADRVDEEQTAWLERG